MLSSTKNFSKHVNDMEEFYDADGRTWVSKSLNIRSFIDKWASLITQTNPFVNQSDTSPKTDILKDILKLNESQVIKIKEECDIKHFDIYEEKFYDFSQDIFPEAITFQTLETQKEDVELRKKYSSYATKTIKELKDHNYPQPFDTKKSSKQTANAYAYVPDDILLLVQVFQPTIPIRHSHYKYQKSSYPLKIEQEFWIHGSQSLTDLREAISCISDLSIIGDFSENPSLEEGVYSCDVYKSGLFFINNTCFVDTRSPENLDYSIEIKEWFKEQKMNIPLSFSMEDVLIKDLDIRLGFTYLYLHQGHCEHLLVFSDMRMINIKDPYPIEEHLPIYVPQPPKRRSLCCICQIYSAKWLVTGNKLHPEHSNFYCDLCYKAFHYDRKGKKLGEFTTQPFVDHSAIV